jgi:hypothetical protein
MLQYFSTINYGFSGGTFTVLDVFKNVQLTTTNPILYTENKIDDERPDQFSNRIYQTGNYYWAAFLANNIRNPLLEWNGNDPKSEINLQNNYPGLVYQFANTSNYNPPSGAPGYTDTKYDSYTGVDINVLSEQIIPGQLILLETGDSSYGLKLFGAGQIPIDSGTDQPHHRQSFNPVVDGITGIKQISCGSFNTAILTETGSIYYWGGNTFAFNNNTVSDGYGSLYFNKTISGCTYIDSTNSGILAIQSDGGITCFGSCTTFNSLYSGITGYVKVAWNEGFTAGVAIKANGTPTYFGSLTTPSGISLYDIDFTQSDCIAINRTGNYGVTGWGPNKNSLFTGFDQGITGITAIALGYNHFLALKDNGVIYGGGSNTDGQLSIPSGTYSKISAGRYHSAALTTDGKMVTWGKIAKVYDNTLTGLTLQKITPSNISGSFSMIDSGAEHIVAKESGTNKKYVGVIDRVDTNFKRIFVKIYNYSDVLPLLLGATGNTDPAGTSVTILANSSSNNYYTVQTVQHQLIGIQRYFDSTTEIIQGGNLLDPTQGSAWKDVYLPGYANAENNEFITVKKNAIEEKTQDDLELKVLNASNVQTIQTIISAQLPTANQLNINI